MERYEENFCLESLADNRAGEEIGEQAMETRIEKLVRQESNTSNFSNSSWCEEAEHCHSWDMQSVNRKLSFSDHDL